MKCLCHQLYNWLVYTYLPTVRKYLPPLTHICTVHTSPSPQLMYTMSIRTDSKYVHLIRSTGLVCPIRSVTKQVGLNLKTENIRTFKSVHTIRFVGVYTDMNTCILCLKHAHTYIHTYLHTYIHTYVHTYIRTVYTHMRTVEHSYNKPEIPGQSVYYT